MSMGVTLAQLRAMEVIYPNISNSDVAEIIGISMGTVCHYARKYKWKKSENFLETYKANSGRKRKVRENEFQAYNYWGMVQSFKAEQWQTHGREHPFYEATKKIYKTQEHGVD